MISAEHFSFWLTTTSLQQEEDVLPEALKASMSEKLGVFWPLLSSQWTAG